MKRKYNAFRIEQRVFIHAGRILACIGYRGKPTVDRRKWATRSWLVQTVTCDSEFLMRIPQEFEDRPDTMQAAHQMAADDGVFVSVWEQRFDAQGEVIDLRLVQIVHPEHKGKKPLAPEYRHALRLRPSFRRSAAVPPAELDRTRPHLARSSTSRFISFHAQAVFPDLSARGARPRCPA